MRSHDIVIMDNLPAHKVHGARTGDRGCLRKPLRYLPPYSPDFNPIEMAFANLLRCAPPPREPFPTSGKPSLTPFVASPQKNAPTISPPQDTMQYERKML